MTDNPSGKKGLYIALIAALLVVIGVLLFFLLRDDSPRRDPNASLGQFEGKSQAEIQAELNKIVEEGMFNISINPTVTMENGSDKAEFRIENIAANHNLMSVQVTLDDTGEVIYTSGLIEPGYYIQSVPLDVVLAKGEYAATAAFTAYDTETEEQTGQAAAKVAIIVKN